MGGWWSLNAGTSQLLKGVVVLAENEMETSVNAELSGSSEDFEKRKAMLVCALDLALKEFLADLKKRTQERKCIVKELLQS
jgi:hypothetical protein